MQNILKKDSKNTVYFTLKEKRLSGGTGQLFVFDDPGSPEQVRFVQNNNLSPDENRFDKFDIYLTGASNVDLTAGTIHLSGRGQYKYTIYEQSSGSTNTKVSATTENVLEKGFLLVEDDNFTGVTQTTEYSQNENDTIDYV